MDKQRRDTFSLASLNSEQRPERYGKGIMKERLLKVASITSKFKSQIQEIGISFHYDYVQPHMPQTKEVVL